MLCEATFELEVLVLEYCGKLGDNAISTICERFCETLEEFTLRRNYYEKTATISDRALESFQECTKI